MAIGSNQKPQMSDPVDFCQSGLSQEMARLNTSLIVALAHARAPRFLSFSGAFARALPLMRAVGFYLPVITARIPYQPFVGARRWSFVAEQTAIDFGQSRFRAL